MHTMLAEKSRYHKSRPILQQQLRATFFAEALGNTLQGGSASTTPTGVQYRLDRSVELLYKCCDSSSDRMN